VLLQRWAQRYFEPAGALGAVAGRNRDSIGDDN